MENCGQPIIMGIPGAELTDSLREFIKRIQPGGFILFNRNLTTPEQIFKLVQELYQLCEIPPVVTLDQEGGRVSRLKVVVEEPPSALDFRKADNLAWCHEHGEITGALLALFGFNLDLAPVVDFSPDEEADNSLRGRCYGTTPDEVIAKASSFLEGMQSMGILGTAKHFPGYTFCKNDPHGNMPLIERTEQEIRDAELQPFYAFAPVVDAMMVGHGHFTAWHQEPFPASLSPIIIQKLLREEMGYPGLIMTDDLEMGAIANNYNMAEAVPMAMEAGNDMLLICHNPACVEIAYDALCAMPPEKLERALQSIQAFKSKFRSPPSEFDQVQFFTINYRIRELKREVLGY